jgi:hypothetical protein
MSLLWCPVFLGVFERGEKPDVIKKETSNPRFDPNFGDLHRGAAYGLGFLVTMVFFVISFIVMICCLNMEGYMADPHSILHVPLLNARGNPGMVFKDDSVVVRFLPTVIHSVLILSLNMIYKIVAEKLVEFENHEFIEDLERSLILKRVPFELLDCFLSLLYLMLWERNVQRLRHDLFGLFMLDWVRRLVMESIVPFITYRLKKRIQLKGLFESEDSHNWKKHKVFFFPFSFFPSF